MTTDTKKDPGGNRGHSQEAAKTKVTIAPQSIVASVTSTAKLPTMDFMLGDLQKSGIDEAMARRLKITPTADGYQIPYIDPITGETMRGANGRPFVRTRLMHPTDGAKYLSPKGAGIRCYVLPEVHRHLMDKSDAALVVTEGEKKAICSTLRGMPCVGLGGIWNWLESGCNRTDGRHAINHDLGPYLTPGREVVFIVDSDAAEPRKAADFQNCARAFAKCLAETGCRLSLAILPELADVGGKVGLDDFILARGLSGDELLHCVHELAKPVEPFKTGTNAAELMTTEFAPIKWIVPELLPEGLAWLVGKSKLGKSWLALGLGVATAEGGVAFSKYRVDQGDVLYMALEDSPRRLQSRLRAMQCHPDEPTPDRLTFWTADDLGGDYRRNIDEIGCWLRHHPEARLVVVDTWGRFSPARRTGGDSYADDTKSLARLHSLAMEYGVCILLVHHCRKSESETDVFDTLLGSTALMAVADSTLILRRGRGDADAELHVTGRDIHEQALAMSFRGAIWKIEGDLSEVKASDQQREILSIMETHGGPITATELAAQLGCSKRNVYKHLQRMADKELVRGDKGKYCHI